MADARADPDLLAEAIPLDIDPEAEAEPEEATDEAADEEAEPEEAEAVATASDVIPLDGEVWVTLKERQAREECEVRNMIGNFSVSSIPFHRVPTSWRKRGSSKQRKGSR